MGADVFYFKHFVIKQDKCAMKVGMDSMLLGSIISPGNSKNILDIGSGTGVLTLMLAQRTKAKIYAVEIDEAAYMQSVENALNSVWKNRINNYKQSLQDFASEIKFDLVISNPPYFPQTNSHKSTAKTTGRAQARDQRNLSYNDLTFHASKLLNDAGLFYVIIPFAEKENFVKSAENNHLHLAENIDIRSRNNTPYIRSILGFSKEKSPGLKHREFTIYEQENIYTDEYISATKQFHAQDMQRKKTIRSGKA